MLRLAQQCSARCVGRVAPPRLTRALSAASRPPAPRWNYARWVLPPPEPPRPVQNYWLEYLFLYWICQTYNAILFDLPKHVAVGVSALTMVGFCGVVVWAETPPRCWEYLVARKNPKGGHDTGTAPQETSAPNPR